MLAVMPLIQREEIMQRRKQGASFASIAVQVAIQQSLTRLDYDLIRNLQLVKSRKSKSRQNYTSGNTCHDIILSTILPNRLLFINFLESI